VRNLGETVTLRAHANSLPDPLESGHVTADRLARASADAMWAADRASREAGMELCDVGPGRATVRMRVTAAMLNGHGLCHGGYVFLLADTAFAVACNTYGDVTVAAGCDIVFAAPARDGDELTATAAERARFGRNGIYDVAVRRADGDLIAELRGRSRATGEKIRL
jgi:acyl-CoA thioesterase